MRTLSSTMTILYKFILPTVWIGGFATATYFLFTDPGIRGETPEVEPIKWVFLFGTIGGTILFYWCCMRLKKVRLDGTTLYISNYFEEIQIPLFTVERVSASILVNPELIWLHLRSPTTFGSKIVFTPPMRTFRGFSRHPMAKDLEGLILQANTGR